MKEEVPVEVLVGVFCFLFLGVPLGIVLGSRIGTRMAFAEVHGTSVDHVPKFREYRFPFVVDFLANCCIGIGLTFQEFKLLVQEFFLKAKGQPGGKATSEQGSDDSRSDSDKQKFVVHVGVLSSANAPRTDSFGGEDGCHLTPHRSSHE